METGLLSQPSTPQATSSHESSPPLANLGDLGAILVENSATPPLGHAPDNMDIEFDLERLNSSLPTVIPPPPPPPPGKIFLLRWILIFFIPYPMSNIQHTIFNVRYAIVY